MDSAAAERNKAPILQVLRTALPQSGQVLEIASGSGQHVVHFAAALPALDWQPTERDAAQLGPLAARIGSAGLTNIRAPVALDVRAEPWPVAGHYDALLCINMIHIAPYEATHALLRGARSRLRAAAATVLVLYGPFTEAGRHTAPSNAAFDEALRRRDPEWGVRDLQEISLLAAAQGFRRTGLVRLPANNLCVIFSRGPPQS